MAISCQLIHGLGNQLFQVAATLSLAWQHGDSAVFNFSKHSQPSQGNKAVKYRRTLYKNLQEGSLAVNYYHQPDDYIYRPIPYSKSLTLSGLFQSEQYFKDCRDRLLQTFDVNIQPIDKVAIHVRRGDFANYATHYILPFSYYGDAIDRFSPTTEFLIFSDDIEWCKNMFLGNRFYFSSGLNDEDDLLLMASCKHQIIANSSLSWWASYFNPSPSKIVIAPSKWLARDVDTSDIYSEWMTVI